MQLSKRNSKHSKDSPVGWIQAYQQSMTVEWFRPTKCESKSYRMSYKIGYIIISVMGHLNVFKPISYLQTKNWTYFDNLKRSRNSNVSSEIRSTIKRLLKLLFLTVCYGCEKRKKRRNWRYLRIQEKMPCIIKGIQRSEQLRECFYSDMA